MCSRTSIRSLPGRGRRRRSPTLSWSRWRSVRRRPARAAAWLHARARERARVRAAARPRRPRRDGDRRQGPLGTHLQPADGLRRGRAADAGTRANRRQPRARTRPRRAAADDRERLLEPERTDAARAASREDTARARATDRPAALLALTLGILLNTLSG